MSEIWELDFYSRPLLDENQKKIWELLICDPERRFEYVKFCPGVEANARWLQSAIEEALPLWRSAVGLGASLGADLGDNLGDDPRPEKIRFFRRQMNSIISRGCAEAGIPVQPSRRTFALYQWLRERAEQVYPQHPGFQPLISPPLAFEQVQAQTLPQALMGQQWAFAKLEAESFEQAQDWTMAFGEVFPLTRLGLAPQTQVPGLIIYSPRAIPLAGWLSGLELAFLTLELQPNPQLVLETGVGDRWILASLKNPQLLAEAKSFVADKQSAGQIHFLAVQADPESDSFAGFWVLQEAELP
jgi:hypothetical protein